MLREVRLDGLPAHGHAAARRWRSGWRSARDGACPSFYLMLAAHRVAVRRPTPSTDGCSCNHGYVPGSGYLEIGWIAFYVLFGVAALHPSMRHLSDRADVTVAHRRRGPPRAAGRSFAAAADDAGGRRSGAASRRTSSVVLAATITLFLLVVIRMAGLVQQQQRSADAEKALREAGAGARHGDEPRRHPPGRDRAPRGPWRATMPRSGCARRSRTARTSSSSWPRRAARTDAIGHVVPPDRARRRGQRERLLDNDAYTVRTYDEHARCAAFCTCRTARTGTVMVAPLFMRDELRGLMVVATPDEMPTHRRRLAARAVVAGRPWLWRARRSPRTC